MTDTVQIETTEQDSRILFVPLNKLKKSPRNARKVPHSEATIEALAASIAHKGLIQNIVIEPEIVDGKPTGFYLVTAGEGRRLAYLLRAKRRETKKTQAVRCWLVINTDRRTYHLELRATSTTYMASVFWAYPQDRLIALRGQNIAAAAAAPVASGIDIAAINFRYRIEGDQPPWRPLRAFDDGRQVYIEFPAGIGQGEMPPLFVIGAGGNGELVNYRVNGHHMIVDRLFAAAELKMGDKASAQRVRIERTDGRSRR
ncbi:hypothetical protein EWE75_09395 [Sphingomonas populi]|uniref:ParB-like N-terminal domain-containing protein n=1 Tax=Sphingomonas populi TaxID=2484750 RepID=A0A4Q6Y5T6_9SPHN|nr:TrbG/VirB9 family P-type conjugative transfer protein [Sphingomonas populi]RZF64819.1 hypothetical protein EWE75_09395 [Sphingomonas populi]